MLHSSWTSELDQAGMQKRRCERFVSQISGAIDGFRRKEVPSVAYKQEV